MSSVLNTYYDKIFIINLFDRREKFENVKKQFNNRGIRVERFVAIDGRCKKETARACIEKLKSFELSFDVTISNDKNLPLRELVPASSLTIGTILLLRAMVRNNWKRMLICEDDIDLTRAFESRFRKGLEEIGSRDYDILYLGCGGQCGVNGISLYETETHRHKSFIGSVYDDEYYIANKNDLRGICDNEECPRFSESISVPHRPTGTWAYSFTLKGAKKFLGLLDNDAGNHIDQLLSSSSLDFLAFDPPIVYHEEQLTRADSSIPWNW